MKTTRNPWPLAILFTFAIFFCGIATVIVIAATHRENLVSENYYEQEMKFQEQIDGAARAQSSGATLAYHAASGCVVLALPAAQLASQPSGTLSLYRPSSPKLDREFALEPRADGTQTLNVSEFAAGLWSVRARWVAGGKAYYLEQKITVTGK